MTERSSLSVSTIGHIHQALIRKWINYLFLPNIEYLLELESGVNASMFMS
jgi:hypothetical protein